MVDFEACAPLRMSQNCIKVGMRKYEKHHFAPFCSRLEGKKRGFWHIFETNSYKGFTQLHGGDGNLEKSLVIYKEMGINEQKETILGDLGYGISICFFRQIVL